MVYFYDVQFQHRMGSVHGVYFCDAQFQHRWGQFMVYFCDVQFQHKMGSVVCCGLTTRERTMLCALMHGPLTLPFKSALTLISCEFRLLRNVDS